MGGWSEECLQLATEMSRSLRFLTATSDLWITRMTSRSTESGTLNEGLSAYAHRQSIIQNSLAVAFACDFEEALIDEPLVDNDNGENDDDENDDDDTVMGT